MFLLIAICDDEKSDLDSEKALIEKTLLPFSNEVDYTIDTFTSSADMLNSDKIYNMVFLDVEMTGLNGIEIAEKLNQKNRTTLLFFVTHHEDYMDEALNKQAFRFWVKPMDESRLEYGIESAIKELRVHRKSITVTVSKKKKTIPVTDIIYIYHEQRLTYIVTTDGIIETNDTFQSVANQLPSDRFFETHMSCCVNLNYVSDYNKTDIICKYQGKIYKPYISTRKYAAFNKRFKEWSGGLR